MELVATLSDGMPVPVAEAVGDGLDLLLDGVHVLELVHGVVPAAGEQRGVPGEVFLVVVPDVGARHVLVLHAGQPAADLPPLHALHIRQHSVRPEISREMKILLGVEKYMYDIDYLVNFKNIFFVYF